jgi:outer membrane protein assembly factor BamD
MKNLFRLVFTTILAVLLSCAASHRIKAKHLYDCSGKMKEAIEKFNKKKYSATQYILTEVLEKCPGHSANDTALYYLGKSWLAMKKPDEAKLEFERLVQSFSNSAFADESRYLLAYSSYLASSPWYLDQTSTKEAREKLKEFLETTPSGPLADSTRLYIEKCTHKLAEKEFQIARFYEKIHRYESAIIYFKSIIEEFPQSSFTPEAGISIAEDLIILNRNSEAEAMIDELIEQSHDQSILKKAAALKDKASKKKQL